MDGGRKGPIVKYYGSLDELHLINKIDFLRVDCCKKIFRMYIYI